MSVPILFKINNKHLIRIMLSSSELAVYETKLNKQFSSWTDDEILACSIDAGVQPTEVKLTGEQYSRNTERSANYTLSEVTIVNCKAKPEFTWSLIKASYVKNLLQEVNYHYGYEVNGIIVPEIEMHIPITYWDFTGIRTIDTYLGQTLEGTLVQYKDTLYWENFRVAFPER